MRTIALIVVALLGGCNTADKSSRTGGMTLELHVEGEGNLAVLYRVEEDGTLGFAGGADAGKGKPTWTGTMSDGEIETLQSLLREHHWLDGGPDAGGEPPEYVTRVRLRWPAGRLRITLRGRRPDVSAVEGHLAKIASRRLEPYLDSLPKGESRPEPDDGL